MKCDYYSNELWEFSSGEVEEDRRLEIEAHLASCPACAGELESIKTLKTSLNNPVGLDVEGAKKRILSKIVSVERGKAVKVVFRRPRPRLFNWFAGSGLAAAIVVAVVIGFLPGSTEALSLDDLLMWHMQCLKDGSHKEYACKTQMDLDEKILRKMGVKPRPFDISHHGDFIAGDVCIINGAMASHALFELDGEKIVSHFHVKDSSGRIKNNKGATKLKDGLYSFSAKGHQILVRELEPGLLDVYIAKTPIENLLRFVKSENI
ncbi:hypothetical protein MNBD_NITROSPINAE02-450 [hydrothermal vent metagenome]|uniref:Putative zinc-finger domain-containing protein n=1 Tax=hydrothermal vent metagenome TaxID=652676 RepID=A0A3B1CN16_9ZZZZ